CFDSAGGRRRDRRLDAAEDGVRVCLLPRVRRGKPRLYIEVVQPGPSFSSAPSFHAICRSIPSNTSASLAFKSRRRTRRRNFSSAATVRGFTYPLVRRTSSSTCVSRSTSPDLAEVFSFFPGAVFRPRTSSYRQTATACPRFIEPCSSRVGI